MDVDLNVLGAIFKTNPRDAGPTAPRLLGLQMQGFLQILDCIRSSDAAPRLWLIAAVLTLSFVFAIANALLPSQDHGPKKRRLWGAKFSRRQDRLTLKPSGRDPSCMTRDIGQ
jgi:hypothetical protein